MRHVAAATPQAPYPARKPPIPSGIGIAPRAPDETDDDDTGGGWSQPPPLAAGDYTFYAHVSEVIQWPQGPSVTFKVLAQLLNGSIVKGPGITGRDLRWDQTPPKFAAVVGSDHYKRWRRDLVRNYAGLGMPDLPNAQTGWAGWAPDEGGAIVPPFYEFFADTIGNFRIPVVLRIEVKVDLGYEQYPKIRTMAFETRTDANLAASYIAAPMPRKLSDWIGAYLGWSGDIKQISIGKGEHTGAIVPVMEKLTAVPLPAGMPTWRDL